MSEFERMNFYKNLIGDAQSTIEAIQRFIEKNNPERVMPECEEDEQQPCNSVNRILNSIVDKRTNDDINKIIDRL